MQLNSLSTLNLTALQSVRPGRILWIMMIFIMGVLFSADSHAQYFGFGKNRVQYTQFDWRFIQSEHFDIYYYSSENYYLSEFTANSLEAAYAQLRDDFKHQLNDRIAVIIYDSHTDFSQTNVVPLPVDAQGIGGVTDKYKNRITIPFMGNYGDFRQVLHHELVHAVFNDMYYGGTIQSIIQNNIQLIMPNWFEEGLAEYVSQGWDSDTDMFMREGVMNNYLPPIAQMRGYMSYRGGQAFWNFIVEEYGRGKIAEILHNVRESRSVEGGLRQSTGLSMSELNDRFHDWLRKIYYPEIAIREDVRDIGKLLTDGSFRQAYNTSPVLSPDGDRLAMITNERGYFDVVVLNTLDGSKVKTLVKGEDNVDFEELNILRPNLTWSPDGRQLALSTRSGGSVDLAIVEFLTGDVQKIIFPDLDAIGSVAWSPDGEKIAFQGNNGPYTSIYIYELESGDFISVTNDVFSDWDPAWTPDSESILFTSDRGAHTHISSFGTDSNILLNPNINQSDIYMLSLGSNRATRLTSTPNWNEFRPLMTRDGRLIYISDQNGIPNVYEMDLDSRTSYPLTDLISGVMQMSISMDGRLLAINSYNRGYVHIFTVNDPFERRKTEPLVLNDWAERRLRETEAERVPALSLAYQMFEEDAQQLQSTELARQSSSIIDQLNYEEEEERRLQDEESSAITDTTETGEEDEDVLDYQNYVFGDDLDDLLKTSHVEEAQQARDTKTDDGRFIPRKYRLDFTPDITYGQGGVSTFYGTYAMAAFMYSDLLGDHRIHLITNLQFDLRNSDYELGYGYYANRTNYMFRYFHTSRNFQFLAPNMDIEQVRFRYYGGGVSLQYPINKFTRVDYGLSFINISRSFSRVFSGVSDTENSQFFYPEVSYTRDLTLPGFLSPLSGTRYAVSLTGSPPLGSNMIGFASVLGDVRKYFHLGLGYVFAFRGSGAASFGPDAQNFFMGGMQNWINYRWEEGGLQSDRLEDLFFTLPALPMRGHFFNSAIGNRFALFNAEFRFPLIAAMLPGPIPFLPLYNIQGATFMDVGAAWQGDGFREQSLDGALAGAGFGLRTILLGLPFRYDIGWPYDLDNGEGFGRRVHYFSIGLDF